MKFLRCLIVLLLATVFLSGEVMAQSQNNRGFGRGRFLKRLRDDVFGNGKQNQAQQQRKAPTPAASKGKDPTPAGKRPTNPYAGKRYANPRQPASRNPIARQADPRKANPRATSQPQSVQSKPKDFGMTIAPNKSDDIVVTRVIPGGNAAKAGVRPGDLVVEVGGAELTSIEEFDSIVEVMSQGDELEFKIQTRGSKPRKMHVQYGVSPEFDDEGAPKTKEGSPEYENGLRSVLDTTSIQANYRSDRVPSPPQYRRASNRPATRNISDQQFQILRFQDQNRRTQSQRQPVNQGWRGPSLNGPSN